MAKPAKLIKNNVLNELDTHEWVAQLHSIQTYDWTVPDALAPHLRMGTLTSPPLAEKIIRFFTKPGAQVFDPFAGEGGILVGAAMAERLASGCDLYAANLKAAAKVGDYYARPMGKGWWGMQRADAVDWLRYMAERDDGKYKESQDLLFTDPPWGIDHGRTQDEGRNKVPFNMVGGKKGDVGAFKTYDLFYAYMKEVAAYSYQLLKPGAYALFQFGDRHRGGQYRIIGAEAQSGIEEAGFQLKGVQHYVPNRMINRRQVFGWGKAFVPLVDHWSLFIYRKPL